MEIMLDPDGDMMRKHVKPDGGERFYQIVSRKLFPETGNWASIYFTYSVHTSPSYFIFILLII